MDVLGPNPGKSLPLSGVPPLAYQSVLGNVRGGLPDAKQAATIIGGVHTEIVITPYDNLTFVIVTQLEKIGTVLSASMDDPTSDDPTFTITTLLGRSEDQFAQLLARQLVDNMAQSSPKPLLLSVALKSNVTIADVRLILKFILQNKTW
eukprot:TRINITY_DN5922_c0_g1_i1.p1 TRINITY_DN5922_c0_g1~~TRINITY_DN5922_c0_g1_i1.p1  ORF type:complete len:149 (-),score=17.27 TRINITY_DN5922_c0_g1_i1:191-637(-)